MCGITGIFNFRDRSPIDPGCLEQMAQALRHRGPDDWGIWYDKGIGLGHTRLSIIDLSPDGHQPMHDFSHRLCITYNGEIYNYQELRDELSKKGHTFKSKSDTEVILNGFREWGEKVVSHLTGIFAFALWDKDSERLFVARDQVGVKPFFFALSESCFRFGSEIKSIITDQAVSREPCPEGIDAYLTFGYSPAPLTAFSAVKQLLPGYAARIDKNGMRSWRYWQVSYQEKPLQISYPEAVAECQKQLIAVVKSQLMSDVPVGLFLSAGIDSAAIAWAVAQLGIRDITALTVGYGNEDRAFDERAPAKEISSILGMRHEVVDLSYNPTELVTLLSEHHEELHADSSMFATYALSREAKKRFTVALGGDGGDEILAGYDTYRATMLAEQYRRVPRLVRKLIARAVVPLIPVSDWKYSLHKKLSRFTYGVELGKGRDHCSWRVMFNEPMKDRVFANDFRTMVRKFDPLSRYQAYLSEVPSEREWLQHLLHADFSFHLPNDMLAKVDHSSMATGLEVRVPIIDIRFVNFVANLPPHFKLGGKMSKRILRDSLRPIIPDSIVDLPKSGFNVPLERWMRTSLRDIFHDTVNAQKHSLERFVKVSQLQALYNEHFSRRADHAHALFTALMLALWFQNSKSKWRASSSLHHAQVASR